MNNHDRIPPIRRARGYRLYADGGVRYLDLWQFDGRAILGHAPQRVRRAFDNVLARGQAGSLPGRWAHRLTRALTGLTGRAGPWQLFSAAEAVHMQLDRAYGRAGWRIADPLQPERDAEVPGITRVELFRPLLSNPVSVASDGPLLLPVPVMVGSGVYALVLPDTEAREAPVFPDLPGMGALPGEPLLAAATRAVYDVVESATVVEEALRQHHRVCAAFDASPNWHRQGLYLRFSGTAAGYERVFARFLGAHVVLSPEARGASIIPQELSAGEQALLVRLAGETEE